MAMTMEFSSSHCHPPEIKILKLNQIIMKMMVIKEKQGYGFEFEVMKLCV
jgi:hypothetical protein